MNSNNQVDTRWLKSGKIRLRFKLSQEGYKIICDALELMGEKFDGVGLEYIALDFLSGLVNPNLIKESITGSNRLLIQLHKDQYDTVRLALDEMRNYVSTDPDAIVSICSIYIDSMKNTV